MKLYQPSTIRDLQKAFGFEFTKSLGQNFLTDQNTIRQIIEKTGVDLDTMVIEIGPGIGVITHELAEDAAKVIAVEIDSKLIPILDFTLRDDPNVKIINEDILKVDLNKLIEEEKEPGDKVKIVGNLPYYITTPIIMKLLEENVKCDSITVMMQKEVADRIKAKPGKKDYGALTVTVQYYCDVETAVNVSKEAFVPRPKVDSTVLILKPRKEVLYEVKDKDLFFKVVRAGFNQRRKTLNNSLMGVENITKDIVKQALTETEIDPIRRAETLSIDEFANLSNKIYDLMR